MMEWLKQNWGVALKTVGLFVAAYGMVEFAAGFRYSVTFDWVAVVAGLAAIGIHPDTRNFVTGTNNTQK